MEKITLTRALVELKTLNNKINRLINQLSVVQVKKGDKIYQTNEDVKDFNKKAKASFQQLNNLIERYNNIKEKIVEANATTKVEIAGKEYTIASAINRKNSIHMYQTFIDRLKTNYNYAVRSVEETNTETKMRLDKMLEKELESSSKTNKETIDSISKPFLAANTVQLADPLDIENLIKMMEEDVENFLAEVDLTLSEVNAKTYIAV